MSRFVFGRLAGLFATSISVFVLAWWTDDDQLARWFVLAGYAVVLAAVMDGGVSTNLIRTVGVLPSDVHRVIAVSARRVAVVWSGVTGVVALLAATGLVWRLPELEGWADVLAVLVLGTMATARRLVVDVAQGSGQHATVIALTGAADRPLWLAAVAAARAVDIDVDGRLLLYLEAAAIAIVAVVCLPRLARRLDSIRRLGNEPAGSAATARDRTLRLWLNSALALGLSQVDVIVAAVVLSRPDVAVYGLAWRIAGLVSVPQQILNLLVPARIAYLARGGDRDGIRGLLGASTTLALRASLLLAVGAVALGTAYASAATGADASTVVVVVAVMVLGQLISTAIGPVGRILMATGHDDAVVAGTLVGIAVMPPGILLLGWAFGVTGAAVGSALAIVAWNAAQGRWLWRREAIAAHGVRRTPTRVAIGTVRTLVAHGDRGDRGDHDTAEGH